MQIVPSDVDNDFEFIADDSTMEPDPVVSALSCVAAQNIHQQQGMGSFPIDQALTILPSYTPITQRLKALSEFDIYGINGNTPAICESLAVLPQNGTYYRIVPLQITLFFFFKRHI